MPDEYFDYATPEYQPSDVGGLEEAKKRLQAASMELYAFNQEPEQMQAQISGQFTPEQQAKYEDINRRQAFAAKLYEAEQLKENNRRQLIERISRNEPEVRYGYGQAQEGMRLAEANQRQMQKAAGQLKVLGVEPWYTTNQRQEVIRLDNARRKLASDSAFTPEEKQRAIAELDSRMEEIIQNPSKKIIDPNKPQFEEGKEPGKAWIDESTGGLFTNEIDAKGNPSVKLLIRPDQMSKTILERENLRAQAAEKKSINSSIFKLLMEPVDKLDSQGNIVGARNRDPAEVAEILRGAYRVQKILSGESASPAALESELERRIPGGYTPPKQNLRGYTPPAQAPLRVPEPQTAVPGSSRTLGATFESDLRIAKKLGLEVSEDDKKLMRINPQVGAASIKFKNLLKLGKGDINKIPQEHKAEALNAAMILENYRRTVVGK